MPRCRAGKDADPATRDRLCRQQNSATVIDRRTLERRPNDGLRRLFDDTPDVNFVGGNYDPLSDVEIRGMGSQTPDVMGNGANRIGMEMDGMTLTPGLNYGYYTRSGRQYLDPADLKEVEIDKGPGAGWLAGSIRLRSKDPEDYLRENARTGGEIRGGYDGENDDISTGASIAARLDDRNSASLSYNRHWFGERKNRSGADIDGPNRHYNNPLDGRSNSPNGKWQYRPNDAHRLKLTLQHYDVDNDSRQRQRIGTASRGAGNILDSRNDRRNVRNAAALRHDIEQPTALFDRMTWQIDAQRSSKGRNINLMPSGNFYDHDDYRTRQYTLKTGFEKSLGGAVRHDLDYSLKLQYGTADFGSETITPVSRRRGDYFTVAKSRQWQGSAQIADRISFADNRYALPPPAAIRPAPRHPAPARPRLPRPRPARRQQRRPRSPHRLATTRSAHPGKRRHHPPQHQWPLLGKRHRARAHPEPRAAATPFPPTHRKTP